jgi:hypothetical protein
VTVARSGASCQNRAEANTGYTHYWEHRTFTPEEWTRVTAGARAVIARAEQRGIALAGLDGSGLPSVNDLNVVLNGAGHGGCEAFQLTRAGGRGFCKTERLPYDAVVVAILCIAEKTGALEWSSDGTDADLESGRRMAEGIT